MKYVIPVLFILSSSSVFAQTVREAPAASPTVAAPAPPTELKCKSMVAHDEKGRAMTYEACDFPGKVTTCQDVQYVDRRGDLRKIRNCSVVDAPK